MKHQFVIECETDKNFQTPVGARQLLDMTIGRVWEIDGVIHGSAVGFVVPKDRMIVSRVEYEAMQAKIHHYESLIANIA
jgi:hypothetical protein